jgi:pyrroline-5-carboxylate reductase
MNHPNLSFIGTGNMASAIIQGLLSAGYPSDRIRGTTARAESAEAAAHNLGVHVDTDNASAIAQADIVLLGVKPQMMAELCRSIAPSIQSRQPTVISLAAGLSVASLSQWLDVDHLRLLRCMANTPVKLGAGVCGFFAPANISAAEQQPGDVIFSLLGTTQWVQHESELHTITAIAGSAPAYFYRFSEALIQAAQQLGISAQDAQQVVTQVALGAARMMQAGDESPAQLRQRVSSPGGTTVEALAVMQQADLDAIMTEAVQACHTRSIELSNALAKAPKDTEE